MPTLKRSMAAIGLLLTTLLAPAAEAGLVLSQAVVDITPGAPAAQDIEVWNDSNEPAYVVAQPSEIVAPGLADEKRVAVVDPAVGGLLVTPQKLILQPGERKLVRIAAIAARPSTDRIWRVTIKPVAGPVTAPASALKLLLGYDVLVIFRPDTLHPTVSGVRNGTTLTLTNQGNTNVELYEGKICQAAETDCTTLPARRLYPGQVWQQPIAATGTITYRVATANQSTVQTFP